MLRESGVRASHCHLCIVNLDDDLDLAVRRTLLRQPWQHPRPHPRPHPRAQRALLPPASHDARTPEEEEGGSRGGEGGEGGAGGDGGDGGGDWQAVRQMFFISLWERG